MISWLPDGWRDQIVDIAHEVDSSIGGYLRGQVMVSLIVALLASIALFVLGISHPIFCGVFAGAASILPFIGVIIATLPALFFAWLQFGVPGAIAVIIAIAILNLVVENPVLSYLTARKFEMPALIVLISVIFWGWLLGLVGMLFAIPFTLLVFLVLHLSDDLRWINAAVGVDHLFSDQNGKSGGK